MKNHLVIWNLCLLGVAALCFPAGAQVLINEFDSDQVSFDTQEFIELYDGGIGGTDLTGLIVVLYSGATDLSYMTIDLTGHMSNSNGFFTIGSTGMGTPIEIPPGALGWLENGPDAIAVYADSAASFPNGTPVTAVNLVDAVVYSNDTTQAPNLIAVLLLSGEFQLNENGVGYGETVSMGRCPDGAGSAFTTSAFTYGLPTGSVFNDCSFVTPSPVPTNTPTQTPTRTPTITPTPPPPLPTAPPCDSEYVANRDMESWTVSGPGGPPDGWTMTIPGGITFTASQESVQVYAGSYSTRLYKTAGGPTDPGTISQIVPFQVVPLAIYTFNAYVYDNDPRGYAHIFVHWRDETFGYLGSSVVSNSSADMDSWQLLTLSDEAPADAYYGQVRIRVFDIEDQTVELYLDDVSLIQPCVPIPTPTPTSTSTPTPTPTQADCDVNFLANPSFENWSGLTVQDWYGDTGISIQPDSVHVYEGLTSASVARNTSGTDMTSGYMRVTGGALYDAGIRVLDNDPNLNARFYVLFYNSGMYWIGSSDWFDTSGENPDFQELSFNLLMIPGNAVWARMRVRFVNNDGSYPPATGITATINVDDGWIWEDCDSSTPTPLATPTPAIPRTIYTIQFTTNPTGDSPYANQTVRTQGIVTAAEPGRPDMFIQDSYGPWNGLHITVPAGPGLVQQGDWVVVQGVVSEMLGMTTIMDPDLIQIVSSGNPLPPPVDISCDLLNQEAYEGVLVRVPNLIVTNVNAGPGEWEAADVTGTLRIDDMYTYTYAPTLDENINWIRGPMSSESDIFKIQPRDDGDIEPYSVPVPAMNMAGLVVLLAVPGISLWRRIRRKSS